jgi:hypothetical protein
MPDSPRPELDRLATAAVRFLYLTCRMVEVAVISFTHVLEMGRVQEMLSQVGVSIAAMMPMIIV